MRRRHLVGAIALALMASSCLGGGATQRMLLVDFSHDEFASFFVANFPKEVTVAQGAKLVFKQTWTGEPHTVTAGTLVETTAEVLMLVIDSYEGLLDEYGSEDRVPADIMEDLDERFDAAWEESGGLPLAFDRETGRELVQSVVQPCYLGSGTPPDAGPCAEQTQPAEFTGRESYYNSGIIPYEGPEGNTFEVQLAQDIAPGVYTFYCAVHGPLQRTQVEVVAEGADVSSAAEVNRRARDEVQKMADPLLAVFREAQDGTITYQGEELQGPFAGLVSDESPEGQINEFVPRVISVRTGQTVSWTTFSGHTISFNVPPYLPIVEWAEDGTVSFNEELDVPTGGAPEIPERDEDDEGPLVIDGGEFDGEGFWSSGTFDGWPSYAEYSVTFTNPGRYKYACLIHPPMVGTVVVT